MVFLASRDDSDRVQSEDKLATDATLLKTANRQEMMKKELRIKVKLSPVVMFLTNVLLKKKPKSKHIMVLMESLVSGHHFNCIRERLADKLEIIRFDPYIQLEAVYKEKKKIKSMKF